MNERFIADLLSPEVAERLAAANAETDSVEDIFALTCDALEEVSMLYKATTGAKEMTGGDEYDAMLEVLRESILAGAVAWAMARRHLQGAADAT